MKILIVYDSFFGNTEKTAQSIAEEINEGNIVNLVKAGSIRAEDIKGIETAYCRISYKGFQADKQQ